MLNRKLWGVYLVVLGLVLSLMMPLVSVAELELPKPIGFPAVLEEVARMKKRSLKERKEIWLRGNLGFAEYIKGASATQRREILPQVVDFYLELTPEGAIKWFWFLQENYDEVGPQYASLAHGLDHGLGVNNWEGWKAITRISLEVDPATWEVILNDIPLPTLREIVIPRVKRMSPGERISQENAFRMIALAKEKYLEALEAYDLAATKVRAAKNPEELLPILKGGVEAIDKARCATACDEIAIARDPTVTAIRTNYAYNYSEEAIRTFKKVISLAE